MSDTIPVKVEEMIVLAEKDVRRLYDAATSAGAREAWVAFLEHANRALNRLEGYAKKAGRLPDYKDLLKKVWEDDLTAYMRVARNIHEHGIEETSVPYSYQDRVLLPDGLLIGGPTVYGINEDGDKFIAGFQVGPTELIGTAGTVVNLRPGIQMVPIRDLKGREIMPPHVAQLMSIDEPAAAAAARVYLDWVSDQVKEFVQRT